MRKTLIPILILSVIGCTEMKESTDQPDIAKPHATKEFIGFLSAAHEYLTLQQDICQQEYNLGEYERWFYDQETELLEFFNGDTLKLRITYQEVGSISKISDTWLWAWANSSILENIRTDSEKIQEFGKQYGFERLAKRKWYADETDGWEMTSIMAYILKSKGAYMLPGEKVTSFVVFSKIERID